MRQCISHSFRSLPTNSSNLDKAFDVLKALNATTSHLNRLILDNERFGRPDVLEHATFRVGQIVRIVENGVSIRGVVKDWTVDLNTKKQSVSIILDAIDFNEHSSELLQLRTPEITLDASKVFHETRANLKRICNETLRQNFLSYDEWYHHNRSGAVAAESQPIGGSYVPNQTLLFRYPLDYIPFPPPDDTSPLKSRASVGGYNSVKDSAQHVRVTAQNMGKYLDELVTSRCAEKSKQDKNPVLDDIQYLIASLAQTSSSASYTDLQSLVQNHSFPLEHILHPSHAFQDTYRTLKTLTELYLTVDQLLQLRFQRFGISYIDNLNPTSRNHPSSASETLASSGESDTLTFQSSVPISPIVRHLDKESSSPSATFAIGQICKHSKFGYKCVITGFDQRPLMDVSGWEAVKGSKYGKEQPFYRCVPDETDVENWLGQGAFRTSFYVAQENLIPCQQPHSQHSQTQVLSSKIKETNPAPPILHRDINMYFDRYDSNTKKFIATTKLRFCFPTSPSQTNITVGGTGVAATQTEEEERLLKEEEEFLRCEALLVEIHQTLKKSLIATREGYLKKYNVAQPAPQQQQQQQIESINSSSQADYTSATSTAIPSLSMDHLFKLLKHATNREDAKITDALISLIGMSHSDTQISKLVRCAISEQKRGSFSKAFEYFQVASAIDPLFAEAHYRQACLNQKAREFNEAIRRYKISLSLFPHHYSSLAGLGSVYENRSNLSSAKAAITSSLDIHPWQEFLPTLLSLVHNAEDSIKSPSSNATPTQNATEQNNAATTASSMSEVNSKSVQ